MVSVVDVKRRLVTPQFLEKNRRVAVASVGKVSDGMVNIVNDGVARIFITQRWRFSLVWLVFQSQTYTSPQENRRGIKSVAGVSSKVLKTNGAVDQVDR
jgi:hypothetical protein